MMWLYKPSTAETGTPISGARLTHVVGWGLGQRTMWKVGKEVVGVGEG